MIVAVINNKGGTGKTTVSVNLGAGLANLGHRVLLVDLDCQRSATRSVSDSSTPPEFTSADVLLHGIPANDAVVQTRVRRLDLLPGGMELAHTDLVLADVPGRENRLRDSLAPIASSYDYILCDCAPSLSMLPVNTLLAADGYLVPLSPEHLAFEGLTSLLEAVHLIEEGMEVELKMLGIVLTMVTQVRFSAFHPEVRDQREIIARVQARYGTDVFRTMITRDPAVARAPASALTVAEAAPKSRGARDFSALASEFLERTHTPSQMNESDMTPHSTNMPFGEDDR